jgi:hypothetical protein
MGFLSKLLRVAPKSEWGGISLDEPNSWEVDPTKDHSKFVRALPTLLPADAIVYFEGTTEPEVEGFLETNRVSDPQKVAIGTIWPVPKRFHVRCSPETMASLALLLDDRSVAYLCTHIHAYRNGKMLMEWHDAFETDPVRISRQINENTIASFADLLGESYSK